jgi:hypothetical protein
MVAGGNFGERRLERRADRGATANPGQQIQPLQPVEVAADRRWAHLQAIGEDSDAYRPLSAKNVENQLVAPLREHK